MATTLNCKSCLSSHTITLVLTCGRICGLPIGKKVEWYDEGIYRSKDKQAWKKTQKLEPIYLLLEVKTATDECSFLLKIRTLDGCNVTEAFLNAITQTNYRETFDSGSHL